MRIALGVEYDGTQYCGWERQRHCVSVQETLERSLSDIANHPVTTTCAGRTDSGVHAWGQVVHFDTESKREPHAWVRGTNARMAADVAVRWAQVVDEHFHARFSAERRRYRYIILNSKARSATLHDRVTWHHEPLDHELMHRAVQALIGTHDFSGYRASRCQARSPVRTVFSAEVVRHGEGISMEITANAFLQHMVRNIMGVLLAIGAGRADVAWAGEVLEGRDRTLGGMTANPSGLYLAEVRYPDEFRLPGPPITSGLW
ncbi:MAG: tRNA pseudouridine(38-40) synthase TruA [Gammaproteobacteria bacterium]|nr:tRNA pseudouridine(38-40) synthase TruA [Gammaproteobacteria bacterium]